MQLRNGWRLTYSNEMGLTHTVHWLKIVGDFIFLLTKAEADLEDYGDPDDDCVRLWVTAYSPDLRQNYVLAEHFCTVTEMQAAGRDYHLLPVYQETTSWMNMDDATLLSRIMEVRL